MRPRLIATRLAAFKRFVYSIRRVGEYLSSFLDLKDFTRKVTGYRVYTEGQRDSASQWSDKSPRTANAKAKEHATSHLIQKSSRQHGCGLWERI